MRYYINYWESIFSLNLQELQSVFTLGKNGMQDQISDYLNNTRKINYKPKNKRVYNITNWDNDVFLLELKFLKTNEQ